MAKTKSQDVEFHPDAWSRFERAMDVVAKSPPQHRVKGKGKRKKSPKSGGDGEPGGKAKRREAKKGR